MAKEKTPGNVAVRANSRGFYKGALVHPGEVFYVPQSVIDLRVKKGGFTWFEPTEASDYEKLAAAAKDASVEADRVKKEAIDKKLAAQQAAEEKRVREAQKQGDVNTEKKVKAVVNGDVL